MSQKKKGNWAKKEITLLTLLANEATSDSRKLLKKYNKSDALNHQDLENKLAELYFQTTDKLELEKEMAKIHPHRDWLLKYESVKIDETKKEPIIEEKKEEIKIEQPTPDVKVVETKATTPVNEECGCMKKMLILQESKSNVTGSEETKTKQNENLIAVLGIVGIVAILGIIVTKK